MVENAVGRLGMRVLAISMMLVGSCVRTTADPQPEASSEGDGTTAATSRADTSSVATAEASHSTGTPTSTSESGGSSESTTTGDLDCSEWSTARACEQAGCTAWAGEAYAWDSATGICAELGPTIVCDASDIALATPYYYWRANEAGEVELVLLHNGPSSLEDWQGCDCSPGHPFACFGCETGLLCSEGDLCADAADAQSCASMLGCTWAPSTVYVGDGDGCRVSSESGRCITGLGGKADCDLVDRPVSCADWPEVAPPYVRPVSGGVELIHWSSCDELPWGYMPCWSAPVGDPPACDCAC